MYDNGRSRPVHLTANPNGPQAPGARGSVFFLTWMLTYVAVAFIFCGAALPLSSGYCWHMGITNEMEKIDYAASFGFTASILSAVVAAPIAWFQVFPRNRD